VTFTAPFASWFKPVHDAQVAAIPSPFIFQHPPELSKTRISDCTREFRIADDSAHVEILDGNRPESANQISRNFIEIIFACICDASLKPSHFPSLTVAAAAAFDSAAQYSLRTAQLRQYSDQRFERLDFFTAREHSQCLESEIDTDSCLILGQHGPQLFYCQGKEVPACRVLGYRNTASPGPSPSTNQLAACRSWKA
jgi:hypothetical protein